MFRRLTTAQGILTTLQTSMASKISSAKQHANSHDLHTALQRLGEASLDYEAHYQEAEKLIQASPKSKTPEKYPIFIEINQLKENIQSLNTEVMTLTIEYRTHLNPMPTLPSEPALPMTPHEEQLHPTVGASAPPPSLPIRPIIIHEELKDNQTLIDLDIADDHKKAYSKAYLKLAALMFSDKRTNIKPHIDALLRQVELLNNTEKEYINTLTMVLDETVLLLEEKRTSKEYHKIANDMKGKPSVGLNVLGGLMMVLAAVAIAGMIAALVISGVGMGFVIAGAATAGTALAVGGSSFFAARRTGLSKAMVTIDEDEKLYRNTMIAH